MMQGELGEMKQKHQELVGAGARYRTEVETLIASLHEDIQNKDLEIQRLGMVDPPGINSCDTVVEEGFGPGAGTTSLHPPITATDASTQADLGDQAHSSVVGRVLGLVEERKADIKTISELQHKLDRQSQSNRGHSDNYQSLLKTVQQQREAIALQYQKQADSLEASHVKKLEALQTKLTRTSTELNLIKLKLAQTEAVLRKTEEQLEATYVVTQTSPTTDLQLLATENYCMEKEAPVTPPAIFAMPPEPFIDHRKMAEIEEKQKKEEELHKKKEESHKKELQQLNSVIQNSSRAQEELQVKVASLEAALEAANNELSDSHDTEAELVKELKEAKHMIAKKNDDAKAFENMSIDRSKTIASLQGIKEDLNASIKALRLRLLTAETDLVQKGEAATVTRLAACKAIHSATLHRTFSNHFRKLALYTEVLRHSRVQQRYQECRFAVADLTSRCTAAEVMHANKDTQVRALASELKAVYSEKEDTQQQLVAAKEKASQHKRNYRSLAKHLKQKAARCMFQLTEHLTMLMAYRLWFAWRAHQRRQKATSKHGSLSAVASVHGDGEAAERLHIVYEYSAEWHDIYEKRDLSLRAFDKTETVNMKERLLTERGKAEAGRALLEREHNDVVVKFTRAIAGHRERLAEGHAAARFNAVRNNCLRKLGAHAVMVKSQRAREREKATAKKALERAAGELNAIDLKAKEEDLKAKAALLLKVIVNSEVALQARYWKNLISFAAMQRHNRAYEEMVIEKARVLSREKSMNTKHSECLSACNNVAVMFKYYHALSVNALKAEGARNLKRCRRRCAGVLRSQTALGVLGRCYHKWGMLVNSRSDKEMDQPEAEPPVSVVLPVKPEKPVVTTAEVRTQYQNMVSSERTNLRRVAVMVRWLAASRETGKKEMAKLREQMGLTRTRCDEQRAELNKARQLSKRIAQMQSILDEATQERAAAQAANDDLQTMAAAQEIEVQKVLKIFRYNQAQCVELGNNLSTLERSLADKRGSTPSEQWADVMLFVQGARGWWKGITNQIDTESPASPLSAMSL
eukprot:TRINITY_DN19946_c0_g1_i1.p1 TRINITY_DN19946_c0_g1~~TRINITY_DN19946_c0_g1_i1.p1  ORF type:complete len:1037 (+),score=215.17 TRINITY_DN19946_c0_g1_i1:92-3202(+)